LRGAQLQDTGKHFKEIIIIKKKFSNASKTAGISCLICAGKPGPQMGFSPVHPFLLGRQCQEALIDS